MLEVEMFFAYLATGAVAGLMSGMLGIGGGIVVVPSLAAIFFYNDSVPRDLHMQVAIGTSLATMMVTLSSSLYAHNKKQSVVWPLVKSILPGLILGILSGVFLVRFLPSNFLSLFFGIFLIVISIQMMFPGKDQPVKGSNISLPKKVILLPSILIGCLSSLLGAGGGTMWVPFFLRCKLHMHEALGTSVACGIITALFATICFEVLGYFLPLGKSIGFIYWPAFFGIAVTSVMFAPIGAAIAYKLSHKALKRVFSVFLLLVALQMIFFAQ